MVKDWDVPFKLIERTILNGIANPAIYYISSKPLIRFSAKRKREIYIAIPPRNLQMNLLQIAIDWHWHDLAFFTLLFQLSDQSTGRRLT